MILQSKTFTAVGNLLELTAGKMGSDCRGLAKPLGLEGRVQRVRVRIGVSVLLVNPYP